MKQDFIKLANGEYAFTDELGKINLIKCDRGEDFAYMLLCKEDELENLEKENGIISNTISRIRKNEKERRIWNMYYIMLVPALIILFFMLKPISLIFGLISSLGIFAGFKLCGNLIYGRKKDNKKKIEYANKKYNENRDRIISLRDEIEKLKTESNFRIIDRDNSKKYGYEFKGKNIENNYDDCKIVHKARLLSYKK